MSILEKDIDINAIDRYLELLTGIADTPMNWRLLPDSERAKADDHDLLRKNFFGTRAEVQDDIFDYQFHEHGVFVIVNAGGNSAKEIDQVRALFVDGDNRPQPDTWHQQPDFLVVRDATHWHAYWRVDDCPIDKFTENQKKLIAHYGTDKTIKDLPRVMRVPGTIHQKDPNRAVQVQLVVLREAWEPVRGMREILDGLSDLTEEHAIEARSNDKPTTIKRLVRYLEHLDPGVSYGDWRDTVAAIRATVLSDGDENDLRRMSHEWSEGTYWPGTPPANYSGPEAVDKVFDTMAPRPGGKALGSIVLAAREGGLTEAMETFGEAPPEIVAAPEEPQTKENRFKMTERLPDPPPVLVPGVLLDGETICIFGPPKHGKTFVALDIGLSLASGASVFGKHKPVRSGPVLYMSGIGEGTAGIKARVRAWGAAREVDTKSLPFFVCEGVPFAAEGVDGAQPYIDDAVEILAGRQPVCVVLDTMAKSMLGLNENDAKDVGKFMALVDGLKKTFECTILVVAHSGKDSGKGLRGSTAGPAGFDGMYGVEQGEGQIIRLSGKGLRYTEDRGPFNFRLEKHGDSAALSIIDDASVFRSLNERKDDMKRRSAATKREELIEIMKHFNFIGKKRGRTVDEMSHAVAVYRTGPGPYEGDKEEIFKLAKKEAKQDLKNGMRDNRGHYAGLWQWAVRGGSDPMRLLFLPDGEEVLSPK